MGGKQYFERFEETWRLPGKLQKLLNFLFMLLRHGANDCLFILEVAIDEANADAGFSADIVHAGEVKSLPGEAKDRGIDDLGLTIGGGIVLEDGRHGGKMNERSFNVKFTFLHTTSGC